MLGARAAWVILFAISLGFWIVLSGRHDALYLGFGVICAAVTAALTVGMERRAHLLGGPRTGEPLFRPGAAWVRFPAYVPWLLWQMVRSALAVAAILVHPRLPISPVIVRLPCQLEGDLPLTTYANSLTLTPGTLTLEAGPGELIVHAITGEAAEDLRRGAMEARVGWTFGGPRR